jgi:hypothetical protein
MLKLFFELFENYSKVGCRFLKFHLATHIVDVIQAFGSMRIVDTRYGEGKNKQIRQFFVRSSKRRRTVAREMTNVNAKRETISRSMITRSEWSSARLSFAYFPLLSRSSHSQ